MAESIALDTHNFTVCLLAAVARKGETQFVFPFTRERTATDAGAHAAWVYLESNFSDAFTCRFAIYNTDSLGRSDDWSIAVAQCEQRGLIEKDSPKSWGGYVLSTDKLQAAATEVCSNQLPWDILADVYIEARNDALRSI